MPGNLEYSIARIFNSDDENGTIAGTGFLLSDRWMITCAHVVRDALHLQEDTPEPSEESIIFFDLPIANVKARPERPLKGRVCFWKDPDQSDDIAVIEIVDPLPDFAQPATILDVEPTKLFKHAFGTFGFPHGLETGNWTTGEILGQEGNGWVQLEKSKSQGSFIQKGCSGAPIWDEKLGGVVGMAVAIRDQDDPDTAFMIPISTILENWAPLSGLPIVTIGSDEGKEIVRGYTQEILTSYSQYWKNYVAAERSNSVENEIFHPVGQVFQSLSYQPQKIKSEKQPDINKQETPVSTTENMPESDATELESPMVFQSLSSICNAIFDSSDVSLVLLYGEPGCGKTLSLRHFMAEQASKIQNASGLIPIYLPLNRYSETTNLEDFIRESLLAETGSDYHQHLARNLEKVIRNHGVLLLLDGVNEIPKSSVKTSVFQTLLAQLNAFSKKYRTRGVLTTRENEFSRGASLPKISIKPFEQIGIREAIALFAPEHASGILNLLNHEPALMELVTNPFRLKSLCQTYHPGMNVPKTPGALYQSLIEVLEKRELGKQGQAKSIKNWSRSLSKLAYHLTENDTTTVADQEIRGILKDPILNFGRSIGLLLHVPDGNKFVHHQIQEYFAAQYLAGLIKKKGTYQEQLAALARRRFWDETFLLLIDILPLDLVDGVIDSLIEADVFLASRCAGISPSRLQPATRERLALSLDELLTLCIEHANYELRDRTLLALGECRTAEALTVLEKYDQKRDLYHLAGSAFINAIANIDTPDAARLIISKLTKHMQPSDRIRSQDLQAFTFALASMKTPEAHEYLVNHVQHPLLYPAVIQAFYEKQNPGFLPDYIDLLHGTLLVSRDDLPKEVFDTICRLAGRDGLDEMIPDLIEYAQVPAAAESLVRLNAGQRVLDQYTIMLRYYLHFMDRKRDLSLFGIDANPEHALPWADITANIGHDASDRYSKLLMDCVQKDSSRSNREQAILLLAMLDDKRLIPILEKLAEQHKGAETDANLPSRKLILDVMNLLQTPGSFGVSRKPLERAALVLYFEKNRRVDTDAMSLAEVMFKALKDPAIVQEQILDGHYSGKLKWRHIAHYHELLIQFNDKRVLALLVNDLLSATQGYGRNEFLAKATNSLIDYGGKSPESRMEVIQKMAPLLLHADKGIVISAIEILAGLKSDDHFETLLSFLSDRTWEIAYVVADNVGRMNLRPGHAERLVERLTSRLPGEKYFALLSLGSLKRAEYVPFILKYWRDSDEFIERAAMWALSEIGSSTPGVVRAISDGLVSKSGWVRLEAARSAGVLGLQDLINRLIVLLEDPDLRVVEQAGIALGELRDERAFPFLLRSLKKSPVPAQYYHEHVWRPEDRLREALAVSCVRCSPKISEVDFDPRLNTDKTNLASGILIGEMHRNSMLYTEGKRQVQPRWKREYQNKEKLQLDTSTIKSEDLEREILQSSNSGTRLEAIQLLLKQGENRLPKDVRYDPNPAVKVQYLINENLHDDSSPSFTWIPIHDLSIASALVAKKPGLILKMPNRWREIFSNSANAALQLAIYFPERYHVGELLDLLLALSEETTLSQDAGAFIARTLDRDRLPRFVRACRTYGWYASSNTTHQHTVEAFIQKRTWSITHDLLAYFGNRGNDQGVQTGFLLARLGVYQAIHWMADDVKILERDELLNCVVQAELLGNLPKHPADQNPSFYERNKYLGKFAVIFANLCCTSNEKGAVQIWGSAVSPGFYDADAEWITRGLRRWGLSAVMSIIEARWERYPQNVIDFCRDIQRNLRSQTGYHIRDFNEQDQLLIEQMIEGTGEEVFQAWLMHSSPGIRTLGLAALMRKGSPTLEDKLGELFVSLPADAVLLLVEYAEAGNMPILLDTLHRLASKSSTALTETQKALSMRIESQIRSDSPKDRSSFIRLIGKYKLQPFAEKLDQILSSNEYTDHETTEAIMQSLVLLGYAGNGESILRRLEAENAYTVKAALQALLFLRIPINSDMLKKMLESGDPNVREYAYILYGLFGTDSLSGVIQQHLSEMEQLLAQQPSSGTRLSENTLLDDPLQPGTHETLDIRTLTSMIESARLSLYIAGISEYFQFTHEIRGYRGTGLFALSEILMAFSSRLGNGYDHWINTTLRFEWLETLSKEDVSKTVMLDMENSAWIGEANREFFMEILVAFLPDFPLSIDDHDQTPQMGIQESLAGLLNSRKYTVNSIARLIEDAANAASTEADSILRAMTGGRDLLSISESTRDQFSSIQSEEQIKNMTWDLIESAAILMVSNKIYGDQPQDEYITGFEFYLAFDAFFTLKERSTFWGEAIDNLVEANNERRSQMLVPLHKIMGLCYARDMIYLVGINLLSSMALSNIKGFDATQSRAWVWKWMGKLTFLHNAIEEIMIKYPEDGQKENPFDVVKLPIKRRVHVSGL